LTTYTFDGVAFNSDDFAGYGYLASKTVGGTPYPQFMAMHVAALADAATSVTAAAGSATAASASATSAAASLASITSAATTQGTSSTSLTVGLGTQTLTASTGKAWLPLMYVAIANAAGTLGMIGKVTAYNSGTGAMTVSVVSIVGSGSGSSWNVFQVAAPATTITLPISARTSNTILAGADLGTIINWTANTFTQTLTAAATLGASWYCWVRNSGTGVITLDPNSSETIDGRTTICVYPNESFLVQCDGTNFITVGRHRGLIFISEQAPSSVANVDTALPVDSELDEIAFEVRGLSASAPVGIRVSTASTYQTASYDGVSIQVMSNQGTVSPVAYNDRVATTIGTPLAYDFTEGALSFAIEQYAGTAAVKIIKGNSAVYRSTGSLVGTAIFSGTWDGGNGALDGVRLFVSTGTLSATSIRMYGRRK
jgi:hypothetical protein